MAITITEKFHPNNRGDWRAWLKKYHDKKIEIWVVFHKKSSGKQRMTISDAIDEALCFGWIDVVEKGIDAERYALRFTPRSSKSSWSERNVERYHALLKEGLMTKAGTAAFERKSRVYTPHMLPGGQKWHETHKMPQNPSLEERIAWHTEHQKFCACREIPKSLETYFT